MSHGHLWSVLLQILNETTLRIVQLVHRTGIVARVVEPRGSSSWPSWVEVRAVYVLIRTIYASASIAELATNVVFAIWLIQSVRVTVSCRLANARDRSVGAWVQRTLVATGERSSIDATLRILLERLLSSMVCACVKDWIILRVEAVVIELHRVRCATVGSLLSQLGLSNSLWVLYWPRCASRSAVVWLSWTLAV